MIAGGLTSARLDHTLSLRLALLRLATPITSMSKQLVAESLGSHRISPGHDCWDRTFESHVNVAIAAGFRMREL